MIIVRPSPRPLTVEPWEFMKQNSVLQCEAWMVPIIVHFTFKSSYMLLFWITKLKAWQNGILAHEFSWEKLTNHFAVNSCKVYTFPTTKSYISELHFSYLQAIHQILVHYTIEYYKLWEFSGSWNLSTCSENQVSIKHSPNSDYARKSIII